MIPPSHSSPGGPQGPCHRVTAPREPRDAQRLAQTRRARVSSTPMRIALLPLLLALSVVEGLAGCSSAVPAPEASPLRTVPERRAGVAVLLHRGCADLAPENTLDACELAFALGAE